MKITVEVCDVCHDPDRPVETWRVGPPGGRLHAVALCAVDSKPLRDLPVVTAGRPRRGKKVVTEDEYRQARRTK